MEATYAPEAIDPATADLARRLQAALGRYGIDLNDTRAIAVAEELDGVDPIVRANLNRPYL